MDRNQAIGLGLIAVLMLLYSVFFMQDAPKTDPAQKQPTTTKVASAATTPAPVNDSLVTAQRVAQLGEFGTLASGQNQTVTLENQVLRLTLGSKGGALEQVELKDYKTWNQKALLLFDKESSEQVFAFQTNSGRTVRLLSLIHI